MYDKDGRYEKQDQRPLQSGWMTGFDNTFLLQQVQDELTELEEELKVPLQEATRLSDQYKGYEERLQALARLAEFQFREIDVTGVRSRVLEAETRLGELKAPDSELAQLKERFDEAQRRLDHLKRDLRQGERQMGEVERTIKVHQRELEQAQILCTRELSAEEAAQYQSVLQCPLEFTLSEVSSLRNQATEQITKSLDSLATKISTSQGNLRASMEKAQRHDTGALAEVGTDLTDLSVYLDRLSYLQREDLPQRQQRFMDYLNTSSTQGVTQLLEQIKSEVSRIKERLTLLNETLRKVEYKAGRFLQLDASEVGSDTLRSVTQAEKRHRRTVLDDQDDGERQYHALKALIEIIREAAVNPKRNASLALLDPRHRLEFYVREVDRETGNTSGKILGSQTGSGGEKEQMASYILTASLSYALSPKGASQPKYATIVLDEAFSKSSHSAASKIITALKEFGLHPLFVTPNKEMSLLKANTASAILVHRATLTSLKWEELDQIHKRRS